MTVYSLIQCIEWVDYIVPHIVCLSDMTVYSLVQYIDVGDILCTSDRVFVSSDGLFDYMAYYSV